MFTFPTMNNSCAMKDMLYAQVHLQNSVAAHILDTTFKVADLNLSTMKQASTCWSEGSGKFAWLEDQAMPERTVTKNLKEAMRNIVGYEQKMAKIILDFQTEMMTIAQEQQARAVSSSQQPLEAAVSNAGAPGLSFMHDMLAQAGKGYAQWADNALHAMDGLDSALSPTAEEKASKPAKSAVRK